MTLSLALLATLLLPTPSASPSPGPATMRGEVVASRVFSTCDDVVHGMSSCREMLHIELLMDHVRYHLVSDENWRRKIWRDLLPLGAYQVRLVKQEKPAAYMLSAQYEVLYADGKTERFNLEGLSREDTPSGSAAGEPK